MFTQQTETPEVLNPENTIETKPVTDDMHESIVYARRVQDGMMLKEKHLQRIFPDSFLYTKPRNLVSGDFYWFSHMNNKIVIAASDCIGHGVPGALMTMLGITLMNQIVIEEKNTDPAFILQRLDHKIHKAFGYTENMFDRDNENDSMDMSVCAIDYKSRTLQFAGACSTMYYVSGRKVHELKGSKLKAGGTKTATPKPFENQLIKLEYGDKVYLATDGFADQFGYFTNKKFTTERLKELLLDISKLPFSRQKTALDKSFTDWKQSAAQTDDVLVVGFKF